MFKKSRRIKKDTEISCLMKNGDLFKSRYLLCKYRKTDNISRFAVAISKKLKARGVVRNALRRKIYEALKSLNVVTGDYFFVLLAIPKENVYEELVHDLENFKI